MNPIEINHWSFNNAFIQNSGKMPESAGKVPEEAHGTEANGDSLLLSGTVPRETTVDKTVTGSVHEKTAEEVKPEAEYSFSPSGTASNQAASTNVVPVTIGIIEANDEHDNTFKKFPRECTIIHQREKFYGDDHSFIINLGDVSYNGNTKEKGPQFFGPVSDILNSEHVEYFVPGNHDLDHGGEFLENQIISHISALTIAANLHEATGKMLHNTVPYTIEEIGGVKVGLIGLTTPKLKESGKEGADKVTVDPILDSAQKFVPEIREKGADVVVLLMHEGVNTARNIAASVPGIDMIIAAHDHKKCAEEVTNPDGRKTVVVEAGGNSNYVGDVAITVDPSVMRIMKIDYKLYSTSGVAPDEDITAIIDKYKKLS